MVSIDGSEVGTTPLEAVELIHGEYELGIRAERFKDYSARVRIEGGGSTETLKVELLPGWAEVTFQSKPSGAHVRIGGKIVGNTPVTVDLMEGAHDYELILEEHKTYRGRIAVEAGEAQTLPTVELDPAEGKLEVTSNPPASSITVDGEYSGQTPLTLFLTPDEPHEISLSRAGYETVTRQVRVRTVRFAPPSSDRGADQGSSAAKEKGSREEACEERAGTKTS